MPEDPRQDEEVPREELIRRLKATEDALDIAMRAAKAAKLIATDFVTAESKKDRRFSMRYALVAAVADQKTPRGSFNAASKLAIWSYNEGLLEAARIAEAVAGNDEWKAAGKALAGEFRRKAKA